MSASGSIKRLWLEQVYRKTFRIPAPLTAGETDASRIKALTRAIFTGVPLSMAVGTMDETSPADRRRVMKRQANK